MRRVLVGVLLLFSVLPLSAKVVGVVIKFRGAVFFQKSGRSGLRRVYRQLPVRDSYRLLVRNNSSVAVLLFNGKVLSLERSGKYRVNAKNMLVTYDDLLRHHRRISSSGISSAVGATRAKRLVRSSPLQVFHPAGALLSKSLYFRIKKSAKNVIVKQVRIFSNGKIVWQSRYATIGQDVTLDRLKRGQRYKCEVVYQYHGKRYVARSFFYLLQLKKESQLMEDLAYIKVRPIQQSVKHYLWGIIYSRYGVRQAALLQQKKAAQMDKRFR